MIKVRISTPWGTEEEAREILLRDRLDLQGKTLAEAKAILRAESQV
jgi:hypothetical protein